MKTAAQLSPAEILERAIIVLEEQGWCQVSLAMYDPLASGNRLCLTSALLAAMGYQLASDTRVNHKWSTMSDVGAFTKGQTGWTVERILLRFSRGQREQFASVVRYLQKVTGEYDLQEWNDSPERTYDDVLDALSRAAANARFAEE